MFHLTRIYLLVTDGILWSFSWFGFRLFPSFIIYNLCFICFISYLSLFLFSYFGFSSSTILVVLTVYKEFWLVLFFFPKFIDFNLYYIPYNDDWNVFFFYPNIVFCYPLTCGFLVYWIYFACIRIFLFCWIWLSFSLSSDLSQYFLCL